MEDSGKPTVQPTVIPVVVSPPPMQTAQNKHAEAHHKAVSNGNESHRRQDGPRQNKPYFGKYRKNNNQSARPFSSYNPELNAKYREEISIAYRKLHAVNNAVTVHLIKNQVLDEGILAKLKHVYEAHIAAMIFYVKQRDTIIESFKKECEEAVGVSLDEEIGPQEFSKVRMEDYPALAFGNGRNDNQTNGSKDHEDSKKHATETNGNGIVLSEVQGNQVSDEGDASNGDVAATQKQEESTDAPIAEGSRSAHGSAQTGHGQPRRGRGGPYKKRRSTSNAQQGDATTDEKPGRATSRPADGEHHRSGEQTGKPKKRKPFRKNKSISGDKFDGEKGKAVASAETKTAEAVNSNEQQHQQQAEAVTDHVDTTEKLEDSPAVTATDSASAEAKQDTSDVKDGESSKASAGEKFETKEGSKGKGFKGKSYAGKRRGKSISGADSIDGTPRKNASEANSPAKSSVGAAA